MSRYRIEMGITDAYVIYVEADSEEQASEIANEIDLSDWEIRDTNTQYFDIYKEN